MFFSSAFRSSFLLPDFLRPPRNFVMGNWVGAAPRYSYAAYLPATTRFLCKCIIDRFCGWNRRIGPDVLHRILRRRHIRERKRRWRSSDIVGRSSYMITSRPITQSVLLKTTGSTDAGSFRIKRNAPTLGFHNAVARPWSETAISAASRPTILSIRIFPSVLSGARPIVMASLVFTKLDDDNSTRSSFGPVGAAAAIARILHVGQK